MWKKTSFLYFEKCLILFLEGDLKLSFQSLKGSVCEKIKGGTGLFRKILNGDR